MDPNYLTEEYLRRILCLDPSRSYLEDVAAEISEFTGETVAEVKRKMGKSSEMGRDLWNQAKPQTNEEILRWYQQTPHYLYNLSAWTANAFKGRMSYVKALTEEMDKRRRKYPDFRFFKKILDFGAGIGDYAIILCRLGYDVTLAEVDGLTFDFAKQRMKTRKLHPEYITVEDDTPLTDSYETVLMVDVLEHLPNLPVTLKHICDHIHPGGLLMMTAQCFLEPINPMHLPQNVKYRSKIPRMLRESGFNRLSKILYEKTL